MGWGQVFSVTYGMGIRIGIERIQIISHFYAIIISLPHPLLSVGLGTCNCTIWKWRIDEERRKWDP